VSSTANHAPFSGFFQPHVACSGRTEYATRTDVNRMRLRLGLLYELLQVGGLFLNLQLLTDVSFKMSIQDLYPVLGLILNI
jgi:hypothetical protein